MPEMSVEFEVYCGTCNEGLCNNTDTRSSHRRGMNQIVVEACPKCSERSKEEGRDEIRDGELAEALNRISELEDLIAESTPT